MTKPNKERKFGTRLGKFVKNFSLLILKFISIVYTKCRKSERIKNAKEEIVPALITGIVITILVVSALLPAHSLSM